MASNSIADRIDEQPREAAAPVVARSERGCLRVHLRDLRGGRSLSEVAQLIGIRGDELGRIERGQTTQIRFSTLLRILTAFDCSADTIFEFERRDDPEGGRYAVALDAFLGGSLPAPAHRRRLRPSAADAQDPAEAAAFAERENPQRSTRAGGGTLNP